MTWYTVLGKRGHTLIVALPTDVEIREAASADPDALVETVSAWEELEPVEAGDPRSAIARWIERNPAHPYAYFAAPATTYWKVEKAPSVETTPRVLWAD